MTAFFHHHDTIVPSPSTLTNCTLCCPTTTVFPLTCFSSACAFPINISSENKSRRSPTTTRHVACLLFVLCCLLIQILLFYHCASFLLFHHIDGRFVFLLDSKSSNHHSF